MNDNIFQILLSQLCENHSPYSTHLFFAVHRKTKLPPNDYNEQKHTAYRLLTPIKVQIICQTKRN